jgi:hypothetical protein
VVRNSTGKAISNIARVAREIIAIFLRVENEGIVAVCGWTPRDVLLDSKGLFEGVVLEFLHQFWGQNFVQLSRCNLFFALRIRAEKRTLSVIDLSL